MVFADYILENTILVLSRGGAFSPLKTPLRSFCMNDRPSTVEHLQLFQNKMTNARQMPGGTGTLGID